MAEYIEREAVLKHKRKMSGADFGGEFWDEAVLCEDIRKIPTADVVPVVRCKDCICSRRLHAEGSKDIFRYCLCDGNFVQDNHYCSCGERRSNDG